MSLKKRCVLNIKNQYPSFMSETDFIQVIYYVTMYMSSCIFIVLYEKSHYTQHGRFKEPIIHHYNRIHRYIVFEDP